MTERTVMQCIPYKHVYSCPSSKISTIGYIALGVHETWHGEGRSEPLVFWIRQSLSKDGYKSSAEFWRGPAELKSCVPVPSCIIMVFGQRKLRTSLVLYVYLSTNHMLVLENIVFICLFVLYVQIFEYNVIIRVFESNISCLQDSKRVQIKKLPFNFAMAKINYSVQAVYLKNTCSHNKCIVVFFPM